MTPELLLLGIALFVGCLVLGAALLELPANPLRQAHQPDRRVGGFAAAVVVVLFVVAVVFPQGRLP
jgi:putative copper export protein